MHIDLPFGAGLEAATVAVAGDAFRSSEEHKGDGFLGVHTVFGLVEDYGLGAVEDGVGDFGAAGGRGGSA